MPEAFSKPSQISKMEPLTIFIKSPAEVFEWILNTPDAINNKISEFRFVVFRTRKILIQSRLHAF